jgi:hypothetical protein
LNQVEKNEIIDKNYPYTTEELKIIEKEEMEKQSKILQRIKEAEEQLRLEKKNGQNLSQKKESEINAKKQEHSDYLFVLTDGLFQQSEVKTIKQEIIHCFSKNILIIGIGVGYYPYGIKNLFPYIVYSREPNKIIEAITLSFSDSKTNNNDLTLKDPNYNELINNDKKFAYLEEFKNFESHSPLVEYLKNIPIFLNSFSIYQGEAKIDEQNGKSTQRAWPDG